jgi:hypothetical protein
MNADTANLSTLRHLTMSGGIPDTDDPNCRATIWKLLLGYLPPTKSHRQQELHTRHSQYSQFCKELIVNPHDDNNDYQDEVEDHPLSINEGSKWKEHFQDVEIKEQIDRDVMRTHPNMHFFSGDDPAAVLHREEIKRGLYLYAKLNPGITYVQGMNELFAPLYYLFTIERADNDINSINDSGSGSGSENNNNQQSSSSSPSSAEVAAFFCFVELMGEFRDHFCKQLDNSLVGIRATLSRLSTLLKRHDQDLWQRLEIVNAVQPQYYAFRWITLALTQEFSFSDALRLWDALIAQPAGERNDYLLLLCLAMLLKVREDLMQLDFAESLKLLQHYPPIDVSVLVDSAESLKNTKTVLALD